MNQYNQLLAKFAAKIVALHDQRKALENDIAVIYKEARQNGVRRHDLKTAIANYHTASAGGVFDDFSALPEDNAEDNDDIARHLAIIGAAIHRVRSADT
jgi:hypothetical protein